MTCSCARTSRPGGDLNDRATVVRRLSQTGVGAPYTAAHATASASHTAAHATAVPPAVAAALGSSSGAPLDTAVRDPLQRGFGHDFSRVRVHAGPAASAAANSIDALAFTAGNQIVLGPAFPAMRSPDGMRAMAHELAHVVQGAGQPIDPTTDLALGGTSDLEEAEADAAAGAIVRGAMPRLSVSRGPGVVRRTTRVVRETAPSPGAQACFVHLHNDEQVARATAHDLRIASATRGGFCANFVHFGTGGSRAIDVDGCSVDPNRIFTPGGIAAATSTRACRRKVWNWVNTELGPAIVECSGGGSGQLSTATTRGRAPLPALPMGFGALPMIAFHNNTVGTPTTIGGFAAHPTEFTAFTTTNPDRTQDDLMLATQHGDAAALTALGTENVVEQLAAASDDGSLSIAARAAQYFNIEVQQPTGARGGGARTTAQAQSVEEQMAITILSQLGIAPCTPATPASSAPAAPSNAASPPAVRPRDQPP